MSTQDDDQRPAYIKSPPEEFVFRVSNGTDVHKLATSIVRSTDEGKRVIVACVGVQTISQAVKSVAIANGRTASRGFVFFMLPVFHVNRLEDGVEHTVIRFHIVKHLIGLS